MGCCQSKWRRHEQPTDKIEKFSKDEEVITEKDQEKPHDISKNITKGKSEHSGQKDKALKPMKSGQVSQRTVYDTSFGQDLVVTGRSNKRQIMLQVIEPSVTHSDFIHQLEIKESVPGQIFANMNNLDDVFMSSQVESRA